MKDHGSVRIPDVEVTVRAAAFDVFSVGFFVPDKPTDVVEVVGSLLSKAEADLVGEILRKCIALLGANDWVNVADLDASAAAETKDPPF